MDTSSLTAAGPLDADAGAGHHASLQLTPRVRVHVIQTGRLVGNETFLRGESWSALARRPEPCTFPVHCYLIEHPEGLIAVDTGMTAAASGPARWQRRFAPSPIVDPGEELGPRLRELGIPPGGVRRVVLTHLDWDHTGGLAHLPNAEVLVHRPERRFASSVSGRSRFRPSRWPVGFDPVPVDLEPSPIGPFPRTLAVTAAGDVRLVPMPGHTIGHVGVLVEGTGFALLLAGDHMLRQDWFAHGLRDGRLVQLGIWNRRDAVETSRRVAALARQRPIVLLPAHDPEAPARLATAEPLSLPAGGASRA